MTSLPIYVEAASGEPPEAYFRKGVVSTPLRLTREAPVAQLDPRVAATIATVSRVAALLPNAATQATMAHISRAAEAVSHADAGDTLAALDRAVVTASAARNAAAAKLATFEDAETSDYLEEAERMVKQEQAETEHNRAAKQLGLAQAARAEFVKAQADFERDSAALAASPDATRLAALGKDWR